MKYILWLTLPLYLLDQVTKLTIDAKLMPGEQIPVIEGFFNIVHVHNSGMAFGLGNGAAWANYVFGAIAALALVGVTILWKKEAFPTKLSKTAVALLISGILGNVTDRFLHGYVIDFLDFKLPLYDKIAKGSGGHFPSFNVADSCICIAAVLLIFASFREEKETSKAAE